MDRDVDFFWRKQVKHMTRFTFAVWLCAWGWGKPVRAWKWGDWKLSLKLRTMGGFDSNVRRFTWSGTTPDALSWQEPVSWIHPQPIGPPPLLQDDGFYLLSARTRLRYARKGWLLNANYQLGTKLFVRYPDENVLAQHLQVNVYRRIQRTLFLGLSLQGNDQRRQNESRETSFGLLQLSLFWRFVKSWQLSFNASYNGFAFRNLERFPETHIDGIADSFRYSYHGDRYQIQLQKNFGRIFRTELSYAFARMFYFFRLLPPTQEGSLPQGMLEARQDFAHDAALSLRLLYEVMLRLTYRFLVYQSDSFGESFVGHRIHL
ncbi:MAG: hypothetical protein AAGJ35_12300, partial [Myxococcota bacterium]